MIMVFGIQRSGTNYLRCLLESSFGIHVAVHDAGWKHWKIKNISEDMAVPKNGNIAFVTIRHPYAWLPSFLRFESTVNKRKAMRLYNTLYTSYRKSHEKPPKGYKKVILVRHESILLDYKKFLINCVEDLNLDIVSWDNPKKVDENDFYTDEKRRFNLNPIALPEINNLIDWNLMEYYGYARI